MSSQRRWPWRVGGCAVRLGKRGLQFLCPHEAAAATTSLCSGRHRARYATRRDGDRAGSHRSHRWRSLQGLHSLLPQVERAATPDAVTGTAARAGRLGAHEGALTLSLVAGAVSPELPAGGESEARKRLSRWLRSSLEGYEDHHDDLSGDKTSRLSPYLHFGCLSPAESVARAEGKPGAARFIRQLCWRDFHHQVLAATPALPRADYRSRGHRRRDEPPGAAGVEGGPYRRPDRGRWHAAARARGLHAQPREASHRLLSHQGPLPRLARGGGPLLGPAGGRRHRQQRRQLAVVAGTGNDTRPNRMFNPIRQAHRFDPDGNYVSRYVSELSGIEGAAVHGAVEACREQEGRARLPGGHRRSS